MKAETRTLQVILRGERSFQIPAYQRPYVWTQEQQWEPLWDDVEATTRRLAEARVRGRRENFDVAKSDKKAIPHFLGAIVVEQHPTAVGEMDIRSVVDGQQRLTTLQLLLYGVLDALIDRGVEGREYAKLRKLVRNDEDVADGDSVYKIIGRPPDRNSLALAFGAEAPPASSSTFSAARAFFAASASDFLNDETMTADPYFDGTPVHGRASLLVATLLSLLKIVVIDLEDVDDAQAIFEALNARGTPLSATDLVKNLLFLRAERDGKGTDALYATYWRRFDEEDTWWRQLVGTGHAQRTRHDWLIGHWLTAETGQVVNVGRLYSEFRVWLETLTDVEEALRRLTKYADAFELMEGKRQGASERESASFRTLRQLNIAVATPVILWLLVKDSNDLAPNERERAIQSVESFVVRRMAARLTTRGYGKAFVEVLRAAQSDCSNSGHAVISALKENPGGCPWPDAMSLSDSFRTARYYGPGGINRQRIAMLLGAIDRRLQEEAAKSEPLQIDYSKLTVEHVIPQKWEETWAITDDDEAKRLQAIEQRKAHIHCIGNLTLVTGHLNPALSNDPWNSKKQQLQDHSKLQLNAILCRNSVWNESAIESRGVWLAQQLDLVWPGPDDSRWVS